MEQLNQISNPKQIISNNQIVGTDLADNPALSTIFASLLTSDMTRQVQNPVPDAKANDDGSLSNTDVKDALTSGDEVNIIPVATNIQTESNKLVNTSNNFANSTSIAIQDDVGFERGPVTTSSVVVSSNIKAAGKNTILPNLQRTNLVSVSNNMQSQVNNSLIDEKQPIANGQSMSKQLDITNANQQVPVQDQDNDLKSNISSDVKAATPQATTAFTLEITKHENANIGQFVNALTANANTNVTVNGPTLVVETQTNTPQLPAPTLDKMVQTVIKEAQTVTTTTTKTIVFQVEPAKLGPINVSLQISDNQVKVEFKMAQAETRQMLAEVMPKLQEVLKATVEPTVQPIRIENQNTVNMITPTAATNLSNLNQQSFNQSEHSGQQHFATDKRKSYQAPTLENEGLIETTETADATINILA